MRASLLASAQVAWCCDPLGIVGLRLAARYGPESMIDLLISTLFPAVLSTALPFRLADGFRSHLESSGHWRGDGVAY
jgi:hypothetical protein